MSSSDSLEYAGKRVVVTGCGSGIGYATARLLGEVGAQVYGTDIRRPDLALAEFVEMDLTDPAAIDARAGRIAGPIDALFNCAGLPPMAPPMDVMKVNFFGTRRLTDTLLPQIRAGGGIVSIGSNGGAWWRKRLPECLDLVDHTGFDDGLRWFEAREELQRDAYNFSKEATVVWTMVRSAATITAGVRMNCISPGAVQTPMLAAIEEVIPTEAIDAVAKPMGRRSSPEEQAWALLMLNSTKASYINGAELEVDGGFIPSRVIAAARG